MRGRRTISRAVQMISLTRPGCGARVRSNQVARRGSRVPFPGDFGPTSPAIIVCSADFIRT
jgi:hypothetical protein